jgi:hypothetical protein
LGPGMNTCSLMGGAKVEVKKPKTVGYGPHHEDRRAPIQIIRDT